MKFFYKQGAAMILFVLFFAFASSALMFSLSQSIFSDLADFNRLTQSKQAFFASESVTEDVVYRRVFGTFSIDNNESLTVGGVTAYSTTTYDSPSDIYMIDSESQVGSTIRKSYAEMAIGAGSAFNYGLQAGNGGIELTGNSSIVGNVYSNGEVEGSVNAEIFGDVVSAGPSGLIEDIHATGSVYADTIDGIEADGDAYYNSDLGGSTVGGTRFSPAANQPTTSLPISTTTIQEWKDAIDDHGTTITAANPVCSSGTYVIDTSITIGYLKIECDVSIEKNTTIVSLDGPVLIEGDLNFKSGPELRIHPSLGRMSVQILADNPADRVGSSIITIENSTDFSGSGDSRSYIMLMSMNESASTGGSDPAIDVANSANGDVLVYAGEGLVQVGNNIDLREVTAYQITVANGSSITYEEGLASLLFTSGPGGAYVLSDWRQGE